MREESCELLIEIFTRQINYLENAIKQVKDIAEKEEDKFSIHKLVLEIVDKCRLNFKSTERILKEYQKLQDIEIAWRKKLNGVAAMDIDRGNGKKEAEKEENSPEGISYDFHTRR